MLDYYTASIYLRLNLYSSESLFKCKYYLLSQLHVSHQPVLDHADILVHPIDIGSDSF